MHQNSEYLTQRPIPLKRSMRLIPMHEVSTRRTRTRWRSRCAKGVCSLKHPEKGEATSVKGGHDIQMTMSARVQPAKGLTNQPPRVIVYGIMVFHPMTPSRDKLHMTLRWRCELCWNSRRKWASWSQISSFAAWYPTTSPLRQVVESDCFKELGGGCTEKKQLHTMKVFDHADKKKLLFGPLSWPTELPAIGYVSKTNP